METSSGTLTFLFTDIEGSTELLRTLRSEYSSLLGDQERIIRDAIGAHGGTVVDTQGDAVFAVFAEPAQALKASAEAQRALAKHSWPSGAELRVRMGVHSGQASIVDGRPVGIAVHRAARISAIAHGGQVLVSQATGTLLDEDESDLDDLSLRSLTELTLKDFERPVRLSQLTGQGLESAFPPLRGMPQPPRAARRRALGVVVAGLAIALAAAALFDWAIPDRTQVYHATANSVVRIDQGSAHVSTATVVGRLPGAVALGAGSVWIANRGDDTISRLDRSGRVSAVVPLDAQPTALAYAGGALWATTGTAGELLEIDPAYNHVSKTLKLAAEPQHPYGGTDTRVGAIAVGAGGIWVGAFRLQKFAGGRRLLTRPIGNISGLAAARGFVWAADTFSGLLTQVDPAAHIIRQISVGADSANGREQVYGITGIAACRNSLWLTDPGGNRVWNVDPASTRIADAVAVPGRPTGIACDGRDIWVTSIGNDTVSEIDTTAARIIRTVHLDRTPAGIAANPKDIWVSVD
jgi:YVTN family beta-propeller protein